MELKSCLLFIFIFGALSACGGGNSSSGGPPPIEVPDVASDPVEVTTPGEGAVQCLDNIEVRRNGTCLLYTSPSPRD